MVLIRQVSRLCGTQLPEASAIAPEHPDWNRGLGLKCSGASYFTFQLLKQSTAGKLCARVKVGWLKPMETCKGNTVLCFGFMTAYCATEYQVFLTL